MTNNLKKLNSCNSSNISESSDEELLRKDRQKKT